MARAMKDSGIEWIGGIPEKWTVPKLLYVLRDKICDGPHETPNYTEEGIPFISIDSLNDTKRISLENVKRFISEEDYVKFSQKTKIEQGDILFSKAATIGKTAIVVNEKIMVWSPLAVIKNDSTKIEKDYLYYLLNCSYLINTIALSGSVNTQINVGMREMEQARIPLPSMYEQVMIARFLDAECAHIDAVMEQTRASIEEYKKLKQAVITQAVTKGIRPNRPMKDSGIDWIGQIPHDWEMRRIKTIFSLRDEKNYLPLEEVNLISLYTDKGVVQHADLEETTGNKASNADGYKKVYENDIIVNIILCWMGAIGRSAYNGVTSPAYDIYIPSSSIECKFYHYYFRTPGFSGDCYKRGKGIMAMRWRTYSDQFRDIRVVMPKLKEQKEIVEYLDEKTNEIDALIMKKQLLIDELESYKKSLIFEYVTGKKEA